MNPLEWVAKLGQRVFQLNGRVEQNTKDIEALRRELKELTDLTRDIADKFERFKDKQEADRQILILSLKNELLQTETRMLHSGRFLGPGNDSKGDLP